MTTLFRIGNPYNFCLIEQGIIVKVFTEVYDLLKGLNRFILSRILLAIGANPDNDLDVITWDQFLKFKNLVAYKDAPEDEMINFTVKVKSWIFLIVLIFFGN